jgi:hypothetical protein
MAYIHQATINPDLDIPEKPELHTHTDPLCAGDPAVGAKGPPADFRFTPSLHTAG